MKTRTRMVAIWAMMAMLLMAFMPLPAKARKGARVEVERNDGTAVRGELLMVKTDCLVVDGQAGGVIVELGDVHAVRIVKESKAGIGFLVGLVGGTLVGYAISSKSPCSGPMLDAGIAAFYMGLPCGALGALIGLEMGNDSVLDINKMKANKFLYKLNLRARIFDASLVETNKYGGLEK